MIIIRARISTTNSIVSVRASARAFPRFFLFSDEDSFRNMPFSIFIMRGFSRYAQNIPIIIGFTMAPKDESFDITESKLNITITAIALMITAQVA